MNEGAAPAARAPRERDGFQRALLLEAPHPLPADFPARLDEALAGGRIAGVIVDPRGVEHPGRAAFLADLVARCHRFAAALFLAEDAAAVIEAGADGALLRAAEGIEGARRLLGLERPIGVTIGRSRHAAMEAGEAGADWLLLGEGEPFPYRLRLVRWWSELFVLPCAARCASPEEGAALLQAGVDFLIPPLAVWDDPERALAPYRDLLDSPRATAAG
ncbi:MAG: thiamine phosphate synthase [Geminicoccaceae bacterium]|nr:thiamine phosphate synthase [Geminicoccaceae bacterium]MDW8124457.1 thiamine phosphate synthase [Geminicoccaceae bacterium]